jgi:hypothetical protein
LRKHNSFSTYQESTEFDDVSIEPIESEELLVESFDSSATKAEMKEAFAEISFLDGNSALERGDQQKAINHYQDALNYTSKKQELFSKIEGNLLSEFNQNVSEQVIKLLVAQNKELNRLSSGLKDKEKITNTQIAKPTNSQIAKPASLRTIKSTNTQIAKPTNSQLSRSYFLEEETIKISSVKKIKALDQTTNTTPKPFRKAIEFSSLIIILFASIGYYSFGASQNQIDSQVKVKLLMPQDQATLKNWPVTFSWNSSKENSSYILQIIDTQGESKGNIVLEFRTSSTSYIPVPDSAKYLSNYHRYKWRVIPITEDKKSLPYSENSGEFLTLTLNKEN